MHLSFHPVRVAKNGEKSEKGESYFWDFNNIGMVACYPASVLS
ncbi:hypothetical protein [Priestia megaterium]|nr:hypothetical protein [Priestia megaterium]